MRNRIVKYNCDYILRMTLFEFSLWELLIATIVNDLPLAKTNPYIWISTGSVSCSTVTQKCSCSFRMLVGGMPTRDLASNWAKSRIGNTESPQGPQAYREYITNLTSARHHRPSIRDRLQASAIRLLAAATVGKHEHLQSDGRCPKTL